VTTLLPLAPGVWLGIGLGGIVDGIVLHQILQWRHMVTSAGYPPDSLPNLVVNTLFDGLFHATTWMSQRRTPVLRDLGFLALGALLVLVGLTLARRGGTRVADAPGHRRAA
jgi:uncharacterized membrane protein